MIFVGFVFFGFLIIIIFFCCEIVLTGLIHLRRTTDGVSAGEYNDRSLRESRRSTI